MALSHKSLSLEKEIKLLFNKKKYEYVPRQSVDSYARLHNCLDMMYSVHRLRPEACAVVKACMAHFKGLKVL